MFVPLIGAASDVVGIQASLLTLVPISAVGAVLLASASRFVAHDLPDAELDPDPESDIATLAVAA